MTALPAAKQLLRQQLRQRRRELGADQVATAARYLAALVEERWADRPLAAYAAMGAEVSTAAVLQARWAVGQVVWLPLVAGTGLQWFALSAAAQLRPGYRGIREPDPQQAQPSIPPAGTVVLVPGVGFTRAGARLGQGGGFYDRALPELRGRGCLLVGVAYGCQVVDALPCAAHDQCMDQVLVVDDAHSAHY